MANQMHLELLTKRFENWNQWRSQNPDIIPDLSGANLEHKLLIGKDLSEANLRGAKLNYVDLRKANLSNANLENVNIYFAHFNDANLFKANLGGSVIINSSFQEANLEACNLKAEIQNINFQKASFTATDLSNVKFHNCDFYNADLSKAILKGTMIRDSSLIEASFEGCVLDGAILTGNNFNRTRLTNCTLNGTRLINSSLVQTDLRGSNLSGCEVYGVSVWDVITDNKTRQDNLVITTKSDAKITVDDIEVAQFIYLLLRRQKLRNVIDTITTKAVLILGRFSPERKCILDTLAEEVRAHNLLPIIYDFEGSDARDLTETIKILAGMSLFVIADVSNPRSSPLELQATIPDYQIPFVTILQEGEQPFAMLKDFNKYNWVLEPVLTYSSSKSLRKAFKKAILDRARAKKNELQNCKTKKMKTQSVEDFLKDD